MAETTTQIPIEWKTTHEVADRLLGRANRPLLERTLALVQNLAAERKWLLTSVKVTHYQDPEVDWEYLLLVLVFDCNHAVSETRWEEYRNVIEEDIENFYQALDAQEQAIFSKMIDYEFGSDPQF